MNYSKAVMTQKIIVNYTHIACYLDLKIINKLA